MNELESFSSAKVHQRKLSQNGCSVILPLTFPEFEITGNSAPAVSFASLLACSRPSVSGSVRRAAAERGKNEEGLGREDGAPALSP